MRSCLTVALCALVLLHAAAPLAAEEIFWKSPVDGNFGDPANWQPAFVPGATDTAIFDLSSSGYSVSNFNSVGRIQVDNDTVRFHYQTKTDWLGLGNNAGNAADLSFEGLYFIAHSVEVGVHPDAQAIFRMGSGNLVTSFSDEDPLGQFVVGAGGKGTLLTSGSNVSNVGAVVVGRDATAEGTLTTKGGQFSVRQDIVVGQAGKGIATFSDGAAVSVGQKLVVGQDTDSEGELLLTSASRFEGRYGQQRMEGATIGDAGKGSFVAEEGADAVLYGAMVVGNQEGSEGAVRVEGVWTSLVLGQNRQTGVGSLIVGNAGKGTFEISDSGQAVLDTSLVLGKEATGNGTLTVRQTAPLGQYALEITRSSEEVVVGDAGTGKLNVTESAHAYLDTSLTIGRKAGSQGEVLVESNSKVTVNGIEIGPEGRGKLTIRSGSLVDAFDSPIHNRSGGTIEVDDAWLRGAGYPLETAITNAGRVINNGWIVGNLENLPGGTLSGDGQFGNIVTQSGGTLAPGNSPGTMHFEQLVFDSGTIEFEISQAEGEAGQQFGWDLIEVWGTASFSGPFTLDLVSLMLPHLPGPVLNFDPSSNYSWTFLTAGAGISGFDPSLVTIETGRFENPHPGTFFVTQTGSALALNYVVPEPASLALAGLGLAALLGAYRRRKK